MPNPIILSLEVRDVYGALLKEKVDVILRHQVLSQVVKVSNNASTKIQIKGLNGAPQIETIPGTSGRVFRAPN